MSKMTARPCPVCKHPTLSNAGALCKACAEKAGLPPEAPPLRAARPCASCDHREIVRVRMRERTSVVRGDTNEERAQPFALTWALGEEFKSLLSFDKVASAEPRLSQAYGLVEAYVCRACGRTELFTRKPQELPLGAEFGTELMIAPEERGYR